MRARILPRCGPIRPAACALVLSFGMLVPWSGGAAAQDCADRLHADAVAAYDGGDFDTARDNWARLAACGDADAQVALGGLYLSGRGVPAPDTARAVSLYRQAAEQGHAVAQLNLGDFYLRGIGVSRDKAEAYRWFTLAARQGRKWAARQRDRLADNMTPTELSRAEKLLKEK